MITERVPLGQAQVIAWRIEAELRPICKRIAIAGSIRRRKESVKDVEILCVPEAGPTNLFGDPMEDAITLHLRNECGKGRWAMRVNAKNATTFGPLNKLMLYDGFPVDIFTATLENWGRDLMIRTGSADWNKRIMQRFIDLKRHGHAYGPHAMTFGNGMTADAPDEETMFRLLGWEYQPPEART